MPLNNQKWERMGECFDRKRDVREEGSANEDDKWNVHKVCTCHHLSTAPLRSVHRLRTAIAALFSDLISASAWVSAADRLADCELFEHWRFAAADAVFVRVASCLVRFRWNYCCCYYCYYCLWVSLNHGAVHILIVIVKLYINLCNIILDARRVSVDV